ncbi:hypothetical protein BT63DRAFT_457231 [Microthyrium microscopicum]|uniref:Protein required for cell viability n=1 Tax=Microthyrium microscopicum TaxID=703497 RepID=A0A6A6U6Q6_9PEZI|nr:hypothetical protein BT63DRAFT_457231 [Microthyrium microscopicum]
MSRTEALDSVLGQATAFIDPALIKKASSPPTKISAAHAILSSEGRSLSPDGGQEVVRRAIQYLKDIHNAVGSGADDSAASASMRDLDMSLLNTVSNLLDFILLEGMYPSLAFGVGFPQELLAKTRLCTKFAGNLPDLGILDDVMTCLNDLAFGANVGIHSEVANRIYNDVLAANSDLAFNPSRSETCRELAATFLDKTLERVNTDGLYQILTALIKPQAPGWLRMNLSRYLSVIPLRPEGVRGAIRFIMIQNYTEEPSSKAGSEPLKDGIILTPEAMSQATRILTSVPSSVSVDEYYTRIAPQLLDLLSGTEGPEFAKAAAFIIANGILHKKNIGAPGTIGWTLFVTPLQNAINPLKETAEPEQGSDPVLGMLVSESRLASSLQSLHALVDVHPNPSLTGRLVRPLILPIWELSCMDFATPHRAATTSLAKLILRLFLRRCGNLNHIILLSKNLIWDDEHEWVFGMGSEGGIAVRVCRQDYTLSAIEKISMRTSRAKQLVELLEQSSLEPQLFSEFLVHLLSSQLLKPSQTMIAAEQDPFLALGENQLIQALMQRDDGMLLERPTQIFTVINQVLLENIAAIREAQQALRDVESASLQGLSNIVNQAQREGNILSKVEREERDDMVATTISLLNQLLPSQLEQMDQQSQDCLSEISTNLESLQHLGKKELSTSTKASLAVAVSNISLALHSKAPVADAKINILSPETLHRIKSSLTSKYPPDRAEAVQRLGILLATPDMQYDVPTIAILLLEVITKDPEEFVYLAAIKVLSNLASSPNASYAVRTYTDAFQDQKETNSLDARLRVAESLIGFVESPVKSEPGLFLRMAEVCLAVAGRRGIRTKELKERAKAERLEKTKQRRAEREWGGEIPDLSTDAAEDDEMDEDARRLELQRLEVVQDILKKWEDSDNSEDPRIRTSALAILSSTFEHVASDMTNEIINSTADVVLAILTIEEGQANAMLRRGAVLVLMAHLRALDRATDNHMAIAGLEGVKWIELKKVLRWAMNSDEDDIVRDQAKTVLESLENFRMRQLLDAGQGDLGNMTSDFTLKHLEGLHVNPERPSEGQKSRIQVLE